MSAPVKRGRGARLALVVGCAAVLWLVDGRRAPVRAAEATLRGVPIALGGYVEGLAVVPTDSQSHRQRPSLMIGLDVAAQPLRELRLVLSITGLVGGTPEDAGGAGVFDLSRAIQDVSPSLEFEEAYVDWRYDDFDVRIGKQKFAWGKLDAYQLNDLLNPEKYYDPLLHDEDARKIGVPALSVSWHAPSSLWVASPRVTMVWVPVHVPFRFADGDERWFPPAAVPPPTFRNQGQVPLALAVENGEDPPRGFTDGNVALRVSGVTRGADWALYYFDGFEPQPLFNAHGRGKLDVLEVVETPAFRRFRAGGGDVAWSVGGATVRAEVAYQARRAFSRNIKRDFADPGGVSDRVAGFLRDFIAGERTPAFVLRDSVQWGLGADYPIDGWIPVAQVIQTHVVENDTRLLIEDVETQLLGTLRKRWLGDRLEGRLGAIYGIEGQYFVLAAETTWTFRDVLDVTAGYIAIGGSRQSLIGQYAPNDEVFFKIRYTF